MNKVLIIISLIVAILLSLPEYQFDRGLIINSLSAASNFLFGTKIGIASIRPNLISMLFALFVILPLFRKKFISLDSRTNIAIAVLDWLFVASFSSCLVNNDTRDWGLFQISPMIIVAIILFFVIKRKVRSIILIAFCLINIVSQISFVSHAMGVYGAIYVLAGGLGIALQAQEEESFKAI